MTNKKPLSEKVSTLGELWAEDVAEAIEEFYPMIDDLIEDEADAQHLQNHFKEIFGEFKPKQEKKK